MSAITQKNIPTIFNGNQVIAFTDAKKVKSIQGYQDLASMEQWYLEDPNKHHLGMQKFFGYQSAAPKGIFPELLEQKAVLEVNGLYGSVTYDVPLVEDKGIRTNRDYSHQPVPGIDESTFKIALNTEFTSGDVLTNDAESGYGQQIVVTEEEVEQVGDTYIHTVGLVTNDKSEYFLPSNLAKGITYYKLNHGLPIDYGTKFSHVEFPNSPGSMTCEFQLGSVRGVEAYVTGAADKRNFSGATASTRDYINKLQAEAERLGELYMMMDVDPVTKQTLPSTARIGATMQWLTFRELERLTAQALLFQKAGTYKSPNGVTKFNEGLWHQLRRGKIIKYARPGGITRGHIKEAVEYIFRGNTFKPTEERKVMFKCGKQAYDNVLKIFSEEVNNQLDRLGKFLGSDRVIPRSPVSGSDLMDLKLEPIRFTDVYLPDIGQVRIQHDVNLDYPIMQDRFSSGFHPEGKSQFTYSMVVWDAEDQQYSNNKEMPRGATLMEGGNANANVYLVKPEGSAMYWGTENGRYSSKTSSEIVSSHKHLYEGYWAWNSVGVLVMDVSRFVMIELDKAAAKGYR